MKDRVRGALLGCALGDALGRPFEMMSPNDPRLASGLEALIAGNRPLTYSDDTQMMMAVAESWLRHRAVVESDVLATLAAHYDPARGYGRGMKRALEAFRRGEDAATSSWAEGSRGNGGAVRVVALACAYYSDLETLRDAADRVTATTHAHPAAREHAVAHALAMAAALRGEPIPAPARPGSPDVLAEESVPFAHTCFQRWSPNFEAVVRNTILAGGDTDSTAAMSGALCGALVGEQALPPGWLTRLEDAAKLRTLADAL